jgi:ribonuclease R
MRNERLPLLYRIHDLPDPFALERIAPALALFGVKIPKKPTPDPALYQQIIDRLHRADGGHIGQRLLLGCLMRAEYSPVNRGHFGLGSSCYCHFTSPIRRYPDLLTHRVLKDWLQGRVDDEYREAAAALAKNAAGISNRTADDSERIEREAVRVKSMEFMKDQEGGVFEGWISGIARSGFFVELVEYPVEGFVPTASLSGDVYAPNASQTRIEGRRGGRSWRLAQRVQVQVIRVHPEVGDMELALIEGGARGTGPKGRSRKKSRKEKGSADQGKMRGKRGRAK